MDLLLILIHILVLGLLFVIGLYGAYLTKPVLPLPGALKNWSEGLIAWTVFWSFIAWGVTVPLTYDLFNNGKLLGITDIWAVFLWSIGVGIVIGITFAVRVQRSYRELGIVGFIGGFALTVMLLLLVFGFIFLLAYEFNPGFLTMGSWNNTNLSDITNVVGLVLEVLYPVPVFIGAKKMQNIIALEKRIIIKK